MLCFHSIFLTFSVLCYAGIQRHKTQFSVARTRSRPDSHENDREGSEGRNVDSSAELPFGELVDAHAGTSVRGKKN